METTWAHSCRGSTPFPAWPPGGLRLSNPLYGAGPRRLIPMYGLGVRSEGVFASSDAAELSASGSASLCVSSSGRKKPSGEVTRPLHRDSLDIDNA